VTGAQSPAPIGGGEAGFRAALAGAAPGEVARTDVSLGEYPDGAPAVAPVIVATGRAPGRTLWVQACVHGPEVGGILGMQAFLRTLDPAKLAGRVILLPVTNPLGFRANQRLTPQDGENLNRAFPGVPDGSPTRQLAEKVFRLALEHADAMLDLHSGGEHAISAHYAIFTDEGSESGADSRAIARASGAPFIWNAPRASLHGAAYLAFLKAGKPAVLFESGGGASDGHRYRELCAGDRGRLPLPRPAAGPAGARRSTGRRAVRNLRARRGGIFVALTGANAVVPAGTPLGYIVDALGDVREKFVSTAPSAVVTAIRRPYMAVYAGDEVLSLVGLDRRPGTSASRNAR
jgi:predicted deacylase